MEIMLILLILLVGMGIGALIGHIIGVRVINKADHEVKKTFHENHQASIEKGNELGLKVDYFVKVTLQNESKTLTDVVVFIVDKIATDHVIVKMANEWTACTLVEKGFKSELILFNEQIKQINDEYYADTTADTIFRSRSVNTDRPGDS